MRSSLFCSLVRPPSPLSSGRRTRWSAAALASLFLLGACQGQAKEGQTSGVSAEPKADRAEELSGTRVEVVVVQPSKRSLSLSVPGEVEGYRDAMLAAPMGGYVERVAVKEGDRVKQGQVLASVDRALHAVRLERTKVELASAERELARAKSLGNSIPRAEIDAAEDRVSAASASLRELSLNVNRAIITAPFAGYVARVDAEVGEVAAPGAPLFRLVQLQPIKVTVALSDRDVAIAAEGAMAKVQLDARSGGFEGKIASISRAADLKTRSFEAVIEVANQDEQLLPGMIANVTLSTSNAGESAAGKAGSKATTPGAKTSGAKTSGAKTEQVAAEESPADLVISQDWLVTHPDGVGVFLEREGKAVWRPVVLGEVVRKQVEVEQGLEAGDALIVVGHRELVDGDPVLVQRRGRCCVEGRASFTD